MQPKAVGLSEKVLGEIQPGLAKLVAEGKLAGAVVTVARHGKVALVGTVGHRDLASKSPMTEDTIFAIASMTKPITCVAAMMLVEEGKLSLDDPVEKFVPAFKGVRVLGDAKDDTEAALATVPAKQTMLVRHLLAHTSGLSYGVAMTGTETERRIIRAYSKANLVGAGFKTISQLPAELAKLPLAHEPGEDWTYGLSHHWIMKYGLGFGLMMLPTPGAAEPVLDFYFWAGAFSTNFWVDPRRDILGVVMTQVVPVTQITQFVQHTVNRAVEN